MQTYILNEEQIMIQELVTELTQAEIKPRAEEIDHTMCCPKEGIEILAEAGLTGCAIPEIYGGTGLDYWCQLYTIEEVAKECASTAYVLANMAEVTEVLLKHGSRDLLETVLTEILGGTIVSIGGNDSFSGKSLKTDIEAEKTENGYLLTGVKKNIANFKESRYCLLAVRQDGENVWFLIDTEYVEVTESVRKLGFKGISYDAIVLENYFVSEDRILKGNVYQTLSDLQTLNMAAIAEGIAQGAISEAIPYVNQRVQFGKTIAQFENTQQVMADMLSKAEAARALVWEAAKVKDSGQDYAYAASLAKIMATDVAPVITRQVVQLMGGYGYSKEYPVERKMRDAKMTELTAGKTSCHKEIVAKTAVVQ